MNGSKRQIACHIIASLGKQKGRHNVGAVYRQGSGLTTGGLLLKSMSCTIIKFIVDAPVDLLTGWQSSIK